MPRTAPFGSWESAITAELVTTQGVGFGSLRRAAEDVVWIERRPELAPAAILVARDPDGKVRELTTPPFDVRTRVHEYGGGSYSVTGDRICFSHHKDQRLHVVPLSGGEPRALTSEGPWRYADGDHDPAWNRLICVREDHGGDGEAVNTIVAIDLDSGEARVLVSGADFYSAPRLSPNGKTLAWISWNHPAMPWDGTNLWTARILSDGTLGEARLIAGGPEESVVQPRWSPDGKLHFISDRSGWWNIHRFDRNGMEVLCSREAEFCEPPWTLGGSSYTFTDGGTLYCSYKTQGRWSLARIDGPGRLIDIPTDMTDVGSLLAVKEDLYFLGTSPKEPPAICVFRAGADHTTLLKTSAQLDVPVELLSNPQSIRFVTEGHRDAFALYYPPTNPAYKAPDGDRPPLLVTTHGGPTASTSSAWNLAVQFWTSRGFAVVDVDYGGSTGYGRPYRERLRGQWGVVDVDDCVSAAHHLVDRGLVDSRRLAIRGGSAGGFTTLAALCFRDVFHAGASYYGVSDLVAIARDTHKFESRYVDGLVAPLAGGLDLLRKRSPIQAVDDLSCPVIFFQGLLDPVVPPSQSEQMYRALLEKGIPTAYLTFDEEYHGLRKPENLVRARLAELAFYGRIFGFVPADDTGTVPIENLD